MQIYVDFELFYVIHGCFFSGFGLGRKKEDGIRPPQLPVLAEHPFVALWSTETPSASSTGIPASWRNMGVLGQTECIAPGTMIARWAFLVCLVVLAAWLTL